MSPYPQKCVRLAVNLSKVWSCIEIFRLCLVRVKAFPENIPFSGNAIFHKGKCFHVFGCHKNSFYGKSIPVFGSFKHFYRKCFTYPIFHTHSCKWNWDRAKKSSKRNKTQQKNSSNPVKLRSRGGGEDEIAWWRQDRRRDR